jgi:molybdopterin-biosynthesis enzyme MoeA-like protein
MPGDSFVDDTTYGVTDDDITAVPVSSAVLELVELEEELIEHMEDIMQYFLDILQVTGGDLAPEKMCMVPHRIPVERWKSKNGTD